MFRKHLTTFGIFIELLNYWKYVVFWKIYVENLEYLILKPENVKPSC